jgi:hypothetical protein
MIRRIVQMGFLALIVAVLWITTAFAAEFGGRVGGGIPIQAATLNDFVLMIFSIVLLVISLFLLHQSVAFQTWASRDDPKAPNAKAGLIFVRISLIFIFLLCILFFIRNNYLDESNPVMGFIRLFSDQPRLLVAPAVIASVIPSIIAIYKFAIANTFIRAGTQSDSKYVRPLLTALVGIMFTLLQLAASIVTLIMFWRTI